MYSVALSASAEIAKFHYCEDYIGSNERVKIDVSDVSVCQYCLCVQKRKIARKKTVQKLWERDVDFAGSGKIRSLLRDAKLEQVRDLVDGAA